MKYITIVIKSIDYFWVVASFVMAAAIGYLITTNIKLNIINKTQSLVILQSKYSTDDSGDALRAMGNLQNALALENTRLQNRLAMCTSARERSNERRIRFMTKNIKKQ